MGRNKILIIDDEPQIVRALELLMQREGFEIRSAGDGIEALHAIEDAAPDLILLDLMMPRMDGFELCQKIRSNPAWKNMIIVILTAKGRDIEREKGMALGADHYVTKPFSTREVVQLIKSALGH
ncbi:MAG TPA: response regulator [Thermodesulfovibrionales bacterium]|nr:response regulator [Thermodesulfovibrionales bacterium]